MASTPNIVVQGLEGAEREAGELPSGTIVARNYRVVRRLGSGGFGTVYLGENLTLEQRVVIKVLRVGERGAGAEEARLLAALEHPNVVQVYAWDETHDCIVMQCLVGRSLCEALEDEGEALDLVSAVRVVQQTAQALAAVHEKGVVHRDVKPENVMLELKAGVVKWVKLIDLGTALRVGRTVQPSAGTPEYCGPEQFDGAIGATPANDVYALGVMLYRLCTGRLPFSGTPEELALAHATAPVPDLVEAYRGGRAAPLEPHLEHMLEEVGGLVEKMMAKRPEDRPDARRVAARLDDLEDLFSRGKTQVRAILLTEVAAAGAEAAAKAKTKTSTMNLPRLQAPVAPGGERPTPASLPQKAATTAELGRVVGPRRWWLAGVALTAVLAVGLAVKFLWPAAGAEAQQPKVDPAGPKVAELPSVELPPKVEEPKIGQPEDLAPLAHVPDRPNLPRKERAPKATVAPEREPACTFDDAYRDWARRALSELRELGHATEPGFKRAEDELGDALVGRDCRRANRAVNELRKVSGLPAP